MSESAVKAKRRELRRAVGLSALAEFQQLEEGVRTLGKATNEQRQAVKTIAEHQATLRRDVTELASAVAIVKAYRPWRARLRWLLTGR